jgi:hypothetical protein
MPKLATLETQGVSVGRVLPALQQDAAARMNAVFAGS